jgi:hypothetical protein
VTTATVTTLRAGHEVRISAPAPAVWRTVTQDVGAWWPTVSRHGSREVLLEAYLGGRVLEAHPGATQGRVWGTVTGVCPTGFLEVRGPMDLPRGVSGLLTVDLEEGPAGTLMRVEHRASGPWEVTRWAMTTSGWRDMAERVRLLVEGRC